MKNSTILKIILAITAIALTVFASSCSPERRLADFAFKNPEIVANYCATAFPAAIGEPTVKTITDTIKEIYYPNCDSVAAAILKANPTISNDSLIALLKKYSTTINNYHTRDSVFIPIKDSAKLAALSLQLGQLSKDIATANIAAATGKKGGTTWMIAFIVLLVVAGVGIFLIIKFK